MQGSQKGSAGFMAHMPSPEAVGPELASSCRRDDTSTGLMQDEAFDQVELAEPRRQLKHPAGVRVASFPAFSDPRWAKVYVLGVILAIESWGEETDHMHSGQAAISSEFFGGRIVPLGFLQLA